MSTNRSSNNNRRRGRGNNRGGPGGGGIQGNRIDSRARGNAPQMLEKYRKMAHDASLNDDRVQTEYYLQFADHYFRVLADSKAPKDEQRMRRDGEGEDGDEYGREDEGGYYERSPEPRANGRAEYAGPRAARDGDRQAGDRQAEGQRDRQPERQSERQEDRNVDRQAERQPDRPSHRQADPQAGTRSDDDERQGDSGTDAAAQVENPFIRDTIARPPRGRPRRRPEMAPDVAGDTDDQGESFAFDASSLPPPIARGTEGDAGTQLDVEAPDAPTKPARAARGMKPRTPRPRTRAARPVDNGADDGDAEPREAVS